MTSSAQDHTALIRKSSLKKIAFNVLLGIIVPMALALIMNQAIAFPANSQLAATGSSAASSPQSTKEQSTPNNNEGAPPATVTPGTNPDVSGAFIFGIMTSDVASDDGYVSASKTVIPTGAAKIYVTAQIMNAAPGMKVTAGITGLTNTVTTPSTSIVTYRPGNIMKAFAFSNHDKPWPAGEYRANVTLSNGKTKQVIFDVR